jgi:hypothetical protein
LRSNALGYRTDYEPSMIVYHPARTSFGELTRKWDRHIAHDYPVYEKTVLGKAKWFFRAVAVAGSPVIEIPLVLRSPRISGWRERGLAFACLCAVRLYRGKRMIGALFSPDGRADRSWRQ